MKTGEEPEDQETAAGEWKSVSERVGERRAAGSGNLPGSGDGRAAAGNKTSQQRKERQSGVKAAIERKEADTDEKDNDNEPQE